MVEVYNVFLYTQHNGSLTTRLKIYLSVPGCISTAKLCRVTCIPVTWRQRFRGNYCQRTGILKGLLSHYVSDLPEMEASPLHSYTSFFPTRPNWQIISCNNMPLVNVVLPCIAFENIRPVLVVEKYLLILSKLWKYLFFWCSGGTFPWVK